jgi:hypothetical protein
MDVTGQLHAPVALTPEERDFSIHWTADWWALEPVWTLWRREKSYPAGNRSQTFQLVVRRCTDWAIPTLCIYFNYLNEWLNSVMITLSHLYLLYKLSFNLLWRSHCHETYIIFNSDDFMPPCSMPNIRFTNLSRNFSRSLFFEHLRRSSFHKRKIFINNLA